MEQPSYLARLFAHPNFKSGVAGAVGSILVAVISTAIFKSES